LGVGFLCRFHSLKIAQQLASDQHLEDAAMHQELEKTVAARKIQLKSFRLYIGLKARSNFKNMVQTRSFEGRLVIDHQRREIDIQVDTTGKAKSSGIGKSGPEAFQSVAGLSGGEKSFSNACFVTSMWEAMDCPLRCMDEYDVFMDAMNRTVTTKMLIEIARSHPHRQFVFLSPLGMNALK
jgi:chromosome segregation ATPase